MTVEIAEAVVEVLADVLEKQAFMFGEACETEDLEPEGTEFLYGTIGFTGFTESELALVAPVTFGQELAANLLGVEAEEVEEADALDSAGELLNVAVGHLLTCLYGHDAVFSLTMPLVKAAGPTEWSQFSGRPSVVGLTVDEYPVAVSLAVRTEVP